MEKLYYTAKEVAEMPLMYLLELQTMNKKDKIWITDFLG